MSIIVTRAGKGSPLTHEEVDANFTNLNTDKLQSGNTAAELTINTATITGGTITGITDLAIADGGTGASTAADARTNLGISASGSDTTYAYRANNLSDLASASTARTNLGLGSIATQNSNSVTITGGSITGITDLAIADGGTGASTASGARTNLGLVIGTDVQAYDADLTSWAAITPSTKQDTLVSGTSIKTVNSTSLLGSGNIDTTPSVGSITTAMLANNSVTPAKMANGGAEFGMRNRIINGAMMIDQRNNGASVTPTSIGVGVYAIDRWVTFASQASKFSIQQNAGSVTPPTGFTTYLGITSLAATSVGASDYFIVSQKIEGFNVTDLNWGTANAQSITITFWVRSSLTGTFGGVVTNNAQNRTYPYTYTVNSANTWEQKSVTISGDTTGTWLTNNSTGLWLIFGFGAGSSQSSTAGAWGSTSALSATGATSVVGTNGATFYITGVQLEKGTQATAFEWRSYGTELALCQRYYQLAGAAASGSFDGSTTTIQITEKLLVTMRTTPSGSIQPSGYAGFRALATDFNAASPALANFGSSTPTSFWTQVTGFTGGTSNAVVTGRNNNANNNFIALSAEL
jgi:hypothetical protein